MLHPLVFICFRFLARQRLSIQVTIYAVEISSIISYLFLLELILSELFLLFLIIRMVSFREWYHHICTPRKSFRHLPTFRDFSGHFNISIGHSSSYKLLKVSINTGYFDSIYRDLDTQSLSCKKHKTNG
jgi:hypothetical protein